MKIHRMAAFWKTQRMAFWFCTAVIISDIVVTELGIFLHVDHEGNPIILWLSAHVGGQMNAMMITGIPLIASAWFVARISPIIVTASGALRLAFGVLPWVVEILAFHS